MSPATLHTIHHYGLKAASLACHGIGFAADAATEVGKTGKYMGIATTAILASSLVANIFNGTQENLFESFTFPTDPMAFCGGIVVISGKYTSKGDELPKDFDITQPFIKWRGTTPICDIYRIQPSQILVPIAFTGAMHLLNKLTPIIAKNAHDLGSYFNDLSNRQVAQIK